MLWTESRSSQCVGNPHRCVSRITSKFRHRPKLCACTLVLCAGKPIWLEFCESCRRRDIRGDILWVKNPADCHRTNGQAHNSRLCLSSHSAYCYCHPYSTTLVKLVLQKATPFSLTQRYPTTDFHFHKYLVGLVLRFHLVSACEI